MRGVFAAKREVIENPKYIAHVLMNMVLNVCEQFGASEKNKVIIAVDSKPSWRHIWYSENCTAFPEYANDDPEDPSPFQTYKGKRLKDPEIPWPAVMEALNELIIALKSFSDLHVIEVPLAEADDIIATVAKYCVASKEDCFIISSDKDFKQLQDGTYIQIYDPMLKVFVPKIDVVQYKRHHILIGDKTDNIKACRPRLGEKTAEKILPVLVETLKLDPNMKARYKFNQKLIDLDQIPEDICVKVMEELHKPYRNYNAMALMKYCSQARLPAVSDRINMLKLSSTQRTTKLNSIRQKNEALERAATADLDAFFSD